MPLHLSLPRLPLRNCFGLFERQLGEDQLWKAGLPGQSLGFIQRETDQMFMSTASFLKLIDNDFLGISNLCFELTARIETNVDYICGQLRLILWDHFHNVFFSSYLFSQVGG